MKKIIVFTAIAALVSFSCKKETSEDPEPETTPTPVSFKFAADVQPIFAASCGTNSTCHGASGRANNMVFENHQGAASVSGATIKGAINHSSGFSAMPQGGSKLSATKIATIEAWIDGGMLND